MIHKHFNQQYNILPAVHNLYSLVTFVLQLTWVRRVRRVIIHTNTVFEKTVYNV